tara:strand:- start:2120 stop:3022 length:903 start_codon:yes stop_codon:yes gene_type:complete
MIKLFFFIFSLLTAQNLYNGQINFNYSGTESGSFNSLLADSTKTGLLINQEDPSVIITSFTEQDDNNYDLFFSILQDTIFPVQERSWEIPGSGDESNPISLEALTLFIPNIDSNFVIQLLDIINDSTNNEDSIDIENYLEDIFLEFSDDLYIGLSGEINFNNVTDSSITGDISLVMLKPAFYFPPHTITIEDGSINFNRVTLPILNTKQNKKTPYSFELFDSYPNPFNPETNIHFFAKNKTVSILIYNINGNIVESVISNFNTSGYHNFKWNANQYPSGVYFLKLISKNSIQTKKIMFIK